MPTWEKLDFSSDLPISEAGNVFLTTSREDVVLTISMGLATAQDWIEASFRFKRQSAIGIRCVDELYVPPDFDPQNCPKIEGTKSSYPFLKSKETSWLKEIVGYLAPDRLSEYQHYIFISQSYCVEILADEEPKANFVKRYDRQ